jgi:PEP-CTERM motif
MKNGISTRSSKILVGAIALMLATGATFAETLIPIVELAGADNVLLVSPVKNDGLNPNFVLTINLNLTGSDTVAALIVDGVAQGPGTYGAGFINPNSALVGMGTITAVPEPATMAMMALGAGLLVGMQRFRRKLR